MANAFGKIIVLLGFLLQVGGGLAFAGLIIYGIYSIFAKTIGTGFMLIGGAVVGLFLTQILASILMAAGAGIASIGEEAEE